MDAMWRQDAHHKIYVSLGKPRISSPLVFSPPSTYLCCNLLPGKHVGIVFQRHMINNHSTSRTSRDRGRSLCARLLWEFSKSRAISEVSHACCCGVCPFRSLSLSLLLLPAASPFSLSSSPTPFLSVSLVPTPPVCFCCLGGLLGCGRERISRVLEFWWEFVEDGACCDRVSLRFGAGCGELSLREYKLLLWKCLFFLSLCLCLGTFHCFTTGLLARSPFFVSVCLRASVFFSCPVNVTCPSWLLLQCFVS